MGHEYSTRIRTVVGGIPGNDYSTVSDADPRVTPPSRFRPGFSNPATHTRFHASSGCTRHAALPRPSAGPILPPGRATAARPTAAAAS